MGACLGVADSANVNGTRRGRREAVACRPCRCGVRRGDCLLCRPPTLPLACFSAPIPPAPFPGGEGGDYRFILPGAAAPGTPALNRLRHLQFPPYRYPAKGCLWLGAKTTEMLSHGQSRQPRRGGTGGEELRRLRWSSPPGQGEQVPPGFSSPPPPHRHHSGRDSRCRREHPPSPREKLYKPFDKPPEAWYNKGAKKRKEETPQ